MRIRWQAILDVPNEDSVDSEVFVIVPVLRTPKNGVYFLSLFVYDTVT